MTRSRSLRQQLTLAVVGGVVLLVLSICAVLLGTIIPAMRTEVRKQINVTSFHQVQLINAQALADLGQNISTDVLFSQDLVSTTKPYMAVLDSMSDEELLKPSEERLQELDARRNELRNLMDKTQRVFLREDPAGQDGTQEPYEPRADLMIFTDPYGRVLFQTRSQNNTQDYSMLGRVLIKFPLSENVYERPDTLWLGEAGGVACVAGEFSNLNPDQVGSYVTYYRHADGHLYLTVSTPVLLGTAPVGVLTLGQRVDLRTAYAASQASNWADAIIVAGGVFQDGFVPSSPVPRDEIERWQRLGSNAPQTQKLGQAVADFTRANEGKVPWLPTGSLAPPETYCGEAYLKDAGEGFQPSYQELSLGGTNYVAMAYPFDLAPVRVSDLNKDRKLGLVLGWLFVMKPTSVADKVAQEQALLVVAVGAIALLVAVLFLQNIAVRLTTPINELAQRMQEVSRGVLPEEEMEQRGTTELMQAATAFNLMVRGLRQKEVLEKFVPLGTREQVAQDKDVDVGKGARVTATVLFSDLRGFTALSERLNPDALVQLLSLYLRTMTEAIYANGGDINEYIGDAILAVFKDKDGKSGAEQAVRAALAMHRALKGLQSSNSNRDLQGLKQGIGINTGVLVQGFIGSDNVRKKDALIGDTVNLAARIQDRSRDASHTYILVSESTYKQVEGRFKMQFFGEETFKGKSQPEKVWEVLE